ncbi:MAG: C4-type zinc ribbon domain-containing protein [Armatimonadota bacterium]|nr:C4-type zinc ribbon domain-containing protein [Armatimonadota bacterium]
MSARLKALFELQNIDLELARAQKAKASLDDGSAKKQKVESARRAFEQADKLLHQTSAELQDKELNLKSVEAKQKMFRDKLYGGMVTNPKELESMEKEIEMLGRQKDKLEENILELMDLVEERKAAARNAKAALEQEESELAALLEKIKQDNASLTARIEALTAERERAVGQVDPALLKKYEAMRGRFGGVYISKVEDSLCSACRMQIMEGVLREIKAGDESRTCENCGRLLFLEE